VLCLGTSSRLHHVYRRPVGAEGELLNEAEKTPLLLTGVIDGQLHIYTFTFLKPRR
jgi:hypothetical protein